MKTTITVIIVLLLGAMLTSCDELHASVPVTPPGPDPVKVLEERVESERQLREEAEAKVEQESIVRGHWQLAALGLSILGILGFFGGTAIGSRGRGHASIPS